MNPEDDDEPIAIDRRKLYERTGNPVYALLEARDCAPEWCRPSMERMLEQYLTAPGDGDALLKAMGLERKRRGEFHRDVIDWFFAEWDRRYAGGYPDALELLKHVSGQDVDKEDSAERQLRRHRKRARELA